MIRRYFRDPYLIPIIVLLLGSLVSGYLYITVDSFERDQIQGEFGRFVQNQVEGLKVQLSKDLGLLSSIQDLIRTYPSVGPDEFQEFTQSRLQQAPYYVSIEWLPLIRHSERKAFRKRMREQRSGYSIVESSSSGEDLIPAERRDAYFPAAYVQPLKDRPENRRALGFDHASVPERRHAMQKARKTGEPIATPTTFFPRFTWSDTSSRYAQESQSPGYLIYLPVFQTVSSGSTSSQSETVLVGYVAALSLVEPQIKNALSAFMLDRYVKIYLYEDASADSERLIFTSSDDSESGLDGPALEDLDHSFLWKSPLKVAGQSWTFAATPKPAFLEYYRSYEDWMTLATGLLVTFILAGYMYQNLTTQQVVRRQVEERTRQLSLEKARFESVVANAGEAILTVDDNGKIVFFNDAAEEIFRYPSAEIQGLNLSLILSEFPDAGPSDPAGELPFPDELDGLVQDRFGTPLRMHGQREDGEEFPLELSVGRWEHEEQTYYTLIIRDVTEREEKEQELKLFNDLIDQSTDSIFVVNPETGRIEMVNQTAHENLGYTRDEIIGMNIMELEENYQSEATNGRAGDPSAGTPSDGTFYRDETWEEHVREVRQQDTMLFECGLLCQDGSMIPVEMNVQYVESQEEQYLVKVARDITERKKTEEELRRHQQLLSESQEMAHLGSFEWEPRPNRLTWSRELYRILGTDPISTEATYENIMGRIHPDDRNEVRRAIRKSLSEGENFELEKRVRRSDGETRHLQIKGEVECDEEGTVTRMRGICLDITDRKRAEKQIRTMNQRLEELVEKRTQELEQFVYAISHDLREPLRVLQNYTDFLNEDLEESNEQVEEDLRFINQSAQHMNRLLDSLLKLSRIGTSELTLEETDLDQCLDTALENLSMRLEEQNAEILRDDLPRLEVDEALIVDLYQNLIGNSLKYVQERPLRIRFTAEQRSGNWVLGVQDNGPGVDPDYQDEIFKPFQQFKHDETQNGIGIGLSICKRIVERHGGEIWLDSEPGEGAHFQFTLHKEEILKSVSKSTFMGNAGNT